MRFNRLSSAFPPLEGALLLSALQTDPSAVQTAADASPQQQISAAEQKRCMDLQMSTALHGTESKVAAGLIPLFCSFLWNWTEWPVC